MVKGRDGAFSLFYLYLVIVKMAIIYTLISMQSAVCHVFEILFLKFWEQAHQEAHIEHLGFSRHGPDTALILLDPELRLISGPQLDVTFSSGPCSGRPPSTDSGGGLP
jgi:hypothetical protein